MGVAVKRFWTTTEARIARARREAGVPYAEIARELGRTRDAVTSFIHYKYKPQYKPKLYPERP